MTFEEAKKLVEECKQAAIQLYNSDENLRECEPVTIVTTVMQAASLRLPLQKNFGYAYIIPRIVSEKIKDKDTGKEKWIKRKVATFQPGYRGLIQLVMRSGEVKNLYAGKVFEGQITSVNCLTGVIETGEKISDKVIGYVANLELVNGFSKTLYMSKTEAEKHARTYSQSYAADTKKSWSMWAKKFDKMATKTLLKNLLKNWGILSVEMQTALQADQSVVDKNSFTYADNGGNVLNRETIDVPAEGIPETEEKTEFVNNETGEVLFEKTAEKTPETVEAPF